MAKSLDQILNEGPRWDGVKYAAKNFVTKGVPHMVGAAAAGGAAGFWAGAATASYPNPVKSTLIGAGIAGTVSGAVALKSLIQNYRDERDHRQRMLDDEAAEKKHREAWKQTTTDAAKTLHQAILKKKAKAADAVYKSAAKKKSKKTKKLSEGKKLRALRKAIDVNGGVKGAYVMNAALGAAMFGHKGVKGAIGGALGGIASTAAVHGKDIYKSYKNYKQRNEANDGGRDEWGYTLKHQNTNDYNNKLVAAKYAKKLAAQGGKSKYDYGSESLGQRVAWRIRNWIAGRGRNERPDWLVKKLAAKKSAKEKAQGE